MMVGVGLGLGFYILDGAPLNNADGYFVDLQIIVSPMCE